MIVVGLLAAGEPSAITQIATKAATSGADVEVVGLVPGDAAWDRRLFELTSAGVGHATIVRSARGSLEPADLELALRYLPNVRCIVLVAPPAHLLATAVAAADFAGAPLVIVGPLDADSPPAAASAPIVLEPPAEDPDGAFAGFVAALAARLEAGGAPDAAFRATVAMLGVDPS